MTRGERQKITMIILKEKLKVQTPHRSIGGTQGAAIKIKSLEDPKPQINNKKKTKNGVYNC